MALITTTKGDMDEQLLAKTTGDFENDDLSMSWEEWRLGDEIVKRNVAMTLKQGLSLVADNSN